MLLATDVGAALLYAVENGADIVNMSFGSYGEPSYRQVIRMAADLGIVLVGAAGNDGLSDEVYPAAWPKVWSVQATDRRRKLATFSNFGPWVDFGAPGVGMVSTYFDVFSSGDVYTIQSGTSFATPLVSGIAGLLRARVPRRPYRS